MTRLRVLLSRFADVILRRSRDNRLDEEIRTHLELLTEEYVARGLSRRDAAQAARRAFGGVQRTREEFREQRGLPLIDAAAQDIRFALRLLARDRTFSVTAVLVLALGIGVNNMLFAILNGHTLRGLPIPDGDRVAFISTVNDRNQDRGLSYPEFEELRGAVQSFSGMVAFAQAPMILSGDGAAAESVDGLYVSGDAFAIAGDRPLLGRAFTADDEQLGAPPVALLGATAWQTRYQANPAVIGRSILVNRAPATIVGVMDDHSGLPTTAVVWLPLSRMPGREMAKRTDRAVLVAGRLQDGAAFEDAVAEVQVLADRWTREYPESNRNIRARVVPIDERYFGRWDNPAWLAFMLAGCLVVLVSSANVANLMLSRTTGRAREMAIRGSLGASRRRMVRQLLIEGSVLAVLGGGLGLALAMAGVRLFRASIPQNALPYWIDYSPDARVIVALLAVSAITVLVFALLPAIKASRTDISRVLKEGGRGAAGGRSISRWSTAFLAAEFALAVVLMSQVAVSLRIQRQSLPTDAAIDTRQVLTATVTLPAQSYPTDRERLDFHRQLSDRLRKVPNITAVSAATTAPLLGGAEVRIDLGDEPPTEREVQRTAWAIAIAPRYFETLGLPLIRGRELLETDDAASPAVIVNQEFVQRFFGGQDPVGRRLSVSATGAPDRPPVWSTIVGVAPDVRQRPVRDPEPLVYTAYAANPGPAAALLIRSRGDTTNLTSRLKDEVAAIDPDLPLNRMQTLKDVAWNASWNGRLSHRLILTLTLIAASLSIVGLYAVTMHAVGRRTHEIGVRMALGARPPQVVGLILRRALTQLAIGFVAGAVCTWLWGRGFASGRADVTASDPWPLVMVGLVLLAAAIVACLVPARRAARLDPVAAIRHE